MKKYLLLTIATVSMLLASCGEAVLVDETRYFQAPGWNRVKPEVFTVKVDNADNYYRIDFEMVVDTTKTRGTEMPLTVNLYSPNGERRMFYATMVLTENGRWKGQPQPGRKQEGLRVLKQTIRPFFTFNTAGEYRLEIGQATSQYDLEGVESFRLDIEQTEIDYEGLK